MQKQRLDRVSISSPTTFTGTWVHPKLSKAIWTALGLKKPTSALVVHGQYHIEWQGCIPFVYIDLLSLRLADGTFMPIVLELDYSHASELLWLAGDHAAWLEAKNKTPIAYAA